MKSVSKLVFGYLTGTYQVLKVVETSKNLLSLRPMNTITRTGTYWAQDTLNYNGNYFVKQVILERLNTTNGLD